MRRITLPWTTTFAYTTGGTKRFMPATGWMDASQVKRVRFVWELISAQTNNSIEAAYQTCNVENSADSAVAVGSALTADGMSYGAMTDISTNTDAKRLVRFGWLCTNTSAATLINARCGGFVDYDSN